MGSKCQILSTSFPSTGLLSRGVVPVLHGLLWASRRSPPAKRASIMRSAAMGCSSRSPSVYGLNCDMSTGSSVSKLMRKKGRNGPLMIEAWLAECLAAVA